MTHSTVCALALVIFAAAPLRAQGTSEAPDAVLDRAVKAYGSMKTARAEFEQTVTNPLLGASAVAHGEFVRKDPNLVAITFTDPAGDRIVADGKAVWAYLPSSYPGKVLKFNSLHGAPNVDPASQFVNAPREHYDVSGGAAATVGGRAVHVVTLRPKMGTVGYPPATVWIGDEDGTIWQFEAKEPSGVVRKVRITKLVRNPDVSASAFVFTTPKDAKVVDAASLLGGKDGER